MKYRIIFLFVVLFFVSGCKEFARYPDSDIAIALNTIEKLSAANTVSAPLNPFAVPIGIGLTGITAILEALRRKERDARKNAETKLNANGQAGKANGS